MIHAACMFPFHRPHCWMIVDVPHHHRRVAVVVTATTGCLCNERRWIAESSRVMANERMSLCCGVLQSCTTCFWRYGTSLRRRYSPMLNRPVRVEVMIIHACRALVSSKAEKFCSSEKCGESFFCSSVRHVIGCLWACIYYALKRSGVAPPC
jgi:uncharacterized membrane protein YeiB